MFDYSVINHPIMDGMNGSETSKTFDLTSLRNPVTKKNCAVTERNVCGGLLGFGECHQ